MIISFKIVDRTAKWSNYLATWLDEVASDACIVQSLRLNVA